MKKITVEFVREKITKNTVRFAEIPEGDRSEVIGALYIKKLHAGDTQNITVTIEGTKC